MPRPIGMIGELRILDCNGNLAALHHPDPGHQDSIIKGIEHRVGCHMPDIDAIEGERFKTFARMHFRKFKVCRDWLNHEEWLKLTNYSQQRKQQLMDADRTWADPHVAESFIKDEYYEEIKAPRSINSYNDKLKYQLGPFIKSLEKTFFSHKFFVKGLDDKSRDKKIESICGDNSVGYTDFSSFESHHQSIYAELFVEFVDYLRCGCGQDEFGLFREVVLGDNVMVFPKMGVRAKVPQRLMSGALWTSFQNSFLNIFLLKYLRFRSNSYCFDWDRNDTLVEGDDGLFLGFNIRRVIIDRLGIKLKLKYASHARYASFCGRVVTDGVCVTDPRKLILKLMWLKMKYSGCKDTTVRGLYKAKAMSYACSYRNSPIIHRLCKEIYDETRRFDHRKAVNMMDNYDREHFLMNHDFVDEPSVPDSARELVEHLYGISACQQMKIEASMKTHSGLLFRLNDFEHNYDYVMNFYSFKHQGPRGR